MCLAEALRNAWRVIQICFYRERRKSGSKWRYLERLEFLGNLSQKSPKKRIAENVKDESMEEPDHEKNELAEYSDESDQKTRENTSNESLAGFGPQPYGGISNLLSALQQSIDASNGLLFAPKPGEGNNSLATEDQPGFFHFYTSITFYAIQLRPMNLATTKSMQKKMTLSISESVLPKPTKCSSLLDTPLLQWNTRN